MNAWRRVIIVAGLVGTAVAAVAATGCEVQEFVYYPDVDAGACHSKDGGGGNGGSGGSGGECP